MMFLPFNFFKCLVTVVATILSLAAMTQTSPENSSNQRPSTNLDWNVPIQQPNADLAMARQSKKSCQRMVGLIDSLNQIEMQKHVHNLNALYEQKLNLVNPPNHSEEHVSALNHSSSKAWLSMLGWVIFFSGIFVSVGQILQRYFGSGSSNLPHLIRNGNNWHPVIPSSGIPHKSKLQSTPHLTDPLTDREMEVLQLLTMGFSNKQISKQLFISPNTAKTHAARIYQKMGVHNRTQAAQKAMVLQLFQQD